MRRRDFLARAARSTVALGAAGAGIAAAASGAGPAADASADPVVDTHMHVWADDPSKYPFYNPYQPRFRKAPYPATVEMLLRDMDQSGVTHAILVQVIYHGWDNRYIANCVRQHPDRFKAHGLIDPTDLRVADRLAWWMEEHGLSGMRFSPIYYQGNDDWLDAEKTHALWRKAAELGAVFNFFIATTQLPRLATMIERHPGVRVVIDHLSQVKLGPDDPTEELQKLLALSRYPNVWVKVSELSSVSESGRYPFPDALPWVRRVYDRFGPDRLLWGTGYPGAARAAYQRPTLDEELALIRQHIPFFSKEDQRKILGLNAARVWNL